MTQKLFKTVALISLVLFGAAIFVVAFKSQNGSNVSTATIQSTQNSLNVTNLTSAQQTTDNRCIITISGKKYDVTTFRTQHTGGDVFNCGTDMTAIFYSRHGSGTLQQMQQYLVN